MSLLEDRLKMTDDVEESKMNLWDMEKWERAFRMLKDKAWVNQLDDYVSDSMIDVGVEVEDVESSLWEE